MKANCRQSGLTLPEMTVVVTIIALLTAIGLPAVRALLNSYQNRSGAHNMISAALAGARAIAAREQHYAGIRFQQDSNGNQYMVFIVHDHEKTGLSPGFRAIEGIKPIKLPESVLVFDLRVRANRGTGPTDAADPTDVPLAVGHLDDTNPAYMTADGRNAYVTDTSTFSIVFSPAGKVVVRTVRVRNRDGIYQPAMTARATPSSTYLFDSPENAAIKGAGVFVQDDYPQLGLGAEPSRNRFVICDRTQFDELNAQGRFNYLNSLEQISINPYTGRIISPD